MLALLTGCAATPAPQAPTPTQDTDAMFRESLKGRFPGNLADAPIMARTICDDFKAGSTFTGEILHLQALAPALTAGNAGYLIGASTSTYCPEYQNRH